MSQQQLMDRLYRLQRKLSASHETWHSGRIDCLVDALHLVEMELRARQADAVGAQELTTLAHLH